MDFSTVGGELCTDTAEDTVNPLLSLSLRTESGIREKAGTGEVYFFINT